MKVTEDTLMDLDKDTVDMIPNFDESLKEPSVLPTRIPLLLVNGASGIAVGMVTNMPPHYLSDTIDAICAYIDDPEIEIDDLIRIDIPARRLDIIGTGGIERSAEEIEKILSERRAHWIKPESQYKKGILDIYTHNSVSPMKGAYMEFFM